VFFEAIGDTPLLNANIVAGLVEPRLRGADFLVGLI
jgi:hypothetical protein